MTVRIQPTRNKPKIPHDMAIPSDLLDWIVEDNYVQLNTVQTVVTQKDKIKHQKVSISQKRKVMYLSTI